MQGTKQTLSNRLNTMPAINERLLSVVLECNTEHQDPSRVTGQEDSEVALSNVNIDTHPTSGHKQRIGQHIFQGGHQRAGEQPRLISGQEMHGRPAPMAIEDDMAADPIDNHGDDTPEEKLKYARLQTEGYQDEGYKESEDDEEEALEFQNVNEDSDDQPKYEYGPESESCAYDDEEDFEMEAPQEGIDDAGGQQRQGNQGEPQMVDLNNYKGIYFDDENEKFQCPVTGAHFKFEDLCNRMERIRVKRGDPLIEFDAKGNKIYVKSVALASKSRQDSQNKESIDSRSLHTAQKVLEKQRKTGESSNIKIKSSKKSSQQILKQSSSQQIVAHQQQQPEMAAHVQQHSNVQSQLLAQQQQEALLQAVVLQMNDSSDKNGSETVKITGSILAAQQEQQAQAQALQASRNAKLSGYDVNGFAEVSASSLHQHTSQQLQNVLSGVPQKESRNKNRIQNPQVTKNSMNGNTLEKLAGSANKLQKQTYVQPLGRNSNLGAMINPAQVKSSTSLLDSASKRGDPKSKLFGGKKSNQPYSLSKKVSGIAHPDLMQPTSQARSKKTLGNQPQSVLSGSRTISSNWTQSVLDQPSMSKTLHASKAAHLYSNSGVNQQQASFYHQRNNQISQGSSRRLQTEFFESMKTDHSALRRQESGSGVHKITKVKGPQNVRNQNIQGGAEAIRSTNTKTKLSMKTKAAESNSNNQVSAQDSRIQKGHQRKINTLQENMQFIKELQKTKSLKSLAHNDSGHQQHIGVASTKKGLSSGKVPAETMKQLAGKTLAQSQFSNLSAKMLINHQTAASGHQKKLSKGEMGTMSKFLQGVKGGSNTQNLALQNPNGHAQQQSLKTHILYSNAGPTKKGGNERKLVKSTSHMQIGQAVGNGPTEVRQSTGKSNQAASQTSIMQALHNPAALKQMHKNMSVAQLNQPHLQGSFLNNLNINSNHTQQEIIADSSHGMPLETTSGRPDSKLSAHNTGNNNNNGASTSKANRQAQSHSQGKIAVGGGSGQQQQSITSLQKTLASTKPSRKKQQYLQKAQLKNVSQQSLGGHPSSFVVNGAGQSLTQRIANSKIVGSTANQHASQEPQTSIKKARKGKDITIFPNDSMLHSSQSKIDSHRSQHHRSSTNLIPQGHLQQMSNLQMTASALLQNLTDKNQMHSYQKSVNQIQSSLLTSQQKEGGLPAKSRNPATQVSLSQKPNGAILHTLQNNLNPLTTQNTASDLGMGGGSAMTLMFNQTGRMTTKSRDGISKAVVVNQNTGKGAGISPSQATVQRLKQQQQNIASNPMGQQPQRVVKRSSNLVVGASAAQPKTMRKSINMGSMDKLQQQSSTKGNLQHASNSGKQSQTYGLQTAHSKKQSTISGGNLFVQQAHMMQMKLLENQALANGAGNQTNKMAQKQHHSSISPKKGDGKAGGNATQSLMFQNLVLPGSAAGTSTNTNPHVATTVMQGQGTARSQRHSLKVDQIQN